MGVDTGKTSAMEDAMEGRRLPRGDEKKAGRLASWGRRDPSAKKGDSGGAAGVGGAGSPGGRDIAAGGGWVIMRCEGQVGDDAMISISPWGGWRGGKIRGEMRKSRCKAVCKVVRGKKTRVDLYRQSVHI